MEENLISIGASVTSHKKLLQETARLLSSQLEDCKEKTVYHQLIEREKLGSTCIGNGVILPHSRSDHTPHAILSLVTLEKPIQANDAQAMSLIKSWAMES